MLVTINFINAIYLVIKVLVSYLANRVYFKGGVCKSKKRLDGKVAIITGANTGKGYENILFFYLPVNLTGQPSPRYWI